jgi:hypothetical protein
MQQLPPTTLLAANGSDPFPCLKDLFALFQRKGIRTVFFSIGASKSALADLEIAESIGCPINIICETEAASKNWMEVRNVLKTHKAVSEPLLAEFSEGAEMKWILPKNVRIFSELVGGEILTTVEAACEAMKVSEPRIDILKIDCEGAAGRGVLYEALDAGFRPALIMIHWSESPDASPPTKIAAGNLQNCGYVLLKKEGTKYLYYFVDNDMYATCSWEQEGSVNPMVDGIVNEVLSQVRSQDAAAVPTTDDDHSLSAIKAIISDMEILVNSSQTPLSSTLSVAKALGLPAPPNGTYTFPLFSTWISKLFEKLDSMKLEGDARAARKELIVALKNLEGRLEDATNAKVVDINMAMTTDAC